ncbi:hypothetical protein CYMTET_38094 [Cymbomonas tetramitiformis]|uniref:Uncharacterized protein n=1 Tax=Cymbomonas tetramitiformis TaxID=36881 RepID=A0AAE0CCL6_9CHLO|nr:hypothetical protein CYMTET_38094 [Cymbomonas tetramitiformis]
MRSGERLGLGSALRAARAAATAGVTPDVPSPPGSTCSGSLSGGSGSEPIVTTASLRRRPAPISRAATALEFNEDEAVWVSTPVLASQQEEYSDRLQYAYAYGEELMKLMRAHGFKPNIGFTFDQPGSEMDFAVLLTNMSHVLGPIAHDEFDKLLDLDHEYPVYHVALNELIYTILPTVLRGLALSLYEESARIHPYDGRCALQRIRFQVEGVVDLDSKRFWLRLRKTVIDETVDPTPQLSVFRTLADRHARLHPTRFTYSSLHNRICKAWRDEGHLARLASPPSPASGGGKGSGGGRGAVGGGVHAFTTPKPHVQHVPPAGEWKPFKTERYLKWEGDGIPCISCFRMFAVTDGHPTTRGVCPYTCRQAFAPGRAPDGARPAPLRPTPDEWYAKATDTPPRAAALQDSLPPPGNGDAPHSAMRVRVAPAAEDFGWTEEMTAAAGYTSDDFEYPALRETSPRMPWPIKKPAAVRQASPQEK